MILQPVTYPWVILIINLILIIIIGLFKLTHTLTEITAVPLILRESRTVY